MTDHSSPHIGSRLRELLRHWPLLRLSSKAQFAVKVAVSLTLAYMVPMAMGWSQPSTAATTVMLIAATGGVRDSLMKGTLRIAGTVVGAVIGLTLIALFAQDRLLYLLSTSIMVSVTLYLYKAYQGDGTLFMLAAVVMLMVFNGGNVEDAFLFGLDRAYMTAFGVVVYTLVGSFLWPVAAERNLAQQARSRLQLDRSLFERLHMEKSGPNGDGTADEAPATPKEVIEQLTTAESALREQWLKARSEDSEVSSWSREWRYLLHYQRQLATALAAAQVSPGTTEPDYARHIPSYRERVTALEVQFDQLLAQWQSSESPPAQPAQDNLFSHTDADDHCHLPHLLQAQLASREETLRDIADLLHKLTQLSVSILQQRPGEFTATEKVAQESAFVAFDPENVKTAIQVFLTFWLSAGIWILLNPPGGYLFVTLSTALVVLVSFTPVAPKLLYILFTLGFVCALPCYIFLLPQLSRSYELALFLFSYTAIAHYLFPAPVNIFFMFGLFTMGIGNDMAYHLDVVLSIMLMFYLVITALLISTYLTFPNRPEYLFRLMSGRLLRHLSRLLELRGTSNDRWRQLKMRYYYRSVRRTLPKLALWASRIDTNYFKETSKQSLASYVDS